MLLKKKTGEMIHWHIMTRAEVTIDFCRRWFGTGLYKVKCIMFVTAKYTIRNQRSNFPNPAAFLSGLFASSVCKLCACPFKREIALNRV